MENLFSYCINNPINITMLSELVCSLLLFVPKGANDLFNSLKTVYVHLRVRQV